MLAGTWYALPDGSDERTLAAHGVQALLDELNAAYPVAALPPTDVIDRQWGWLPLEDPGEARRVAERAVDRVMAVLDGPKGRCRTAELAP